jgi:hypothetical protein
VVGSRQFVKVPGREFAPLAAFEAGADVVAVQAALAMWFIPILVTGVITFSVGIFAFAKGIADSRILKVLPQLQQLGGFKEFIALGDGQNSELLSVTL